MSTELHANHVALLREEHGHMEIMMDIVMDIQHVIHVELLLNDR